MNPDYRELAPFVQNSNKDTNEALKLMCLERFLTLNAAAVPENAPLAYFNQGAQNRPLHPARTMSYEDYFTTGFLQAFEQSRLYSQKEIKEITRFCETYERVHNGLVLFSLLPPEHRPEMAQYIIDEMQFRTGWQRILDIWPEAPRQTVGEHSQNSTYLSLLVYPESIITPLPMVMHGHDILEGPIGDFTPSCLSDYSRKSMLESLIGRYVYEDKNSELSATSQGGNNIFEGEDSVYRRIRHQGQNIDLLEMLVTATHYEYIAPAKKLSKIKEITVPFFDYIEKGLNDEKSKAFYQSYMGLKQNNHSKKTATDLAIEAARKVSPNNPVTITAEAFSFGTPQAKPPFAEISTALTRAKTKAEATPPPPQYP